MAVRFRTTRISNPRFEQGGIRHITAKSPALKKRVDTSVFIPIEANGKADVPVIVLLHGVYGSHFSWNMGAGAYLTLQRMISNGKIEPFVLVTPSDGLWGDGSGYVDHGVENYEAWIATELPALISQEIDEIGKGSEYYIGGLSMGGWGAFWIGLHYPQQYKAISGHSSITHIMELKDFVEEEWTEWAERQQIVSIEELILENRAKLPPFRFDCGTEDVLYAGNKALHEALESHNIEHTYEEYPGAHEWPYWEQHVERTFLYFDQVRNQNS